MKNKANSKIHILILIISLLIISCNTKITSSCLGDCNNGEGTKTWTDSGVEKGTWVNGKLNGKGTQFFGTTSEFAGDTYEGDFIDDLYHGYGSYYDKSEDSRFIGEWENGKPNGKGKAMWGKKSKFPNRYYEGEWKDGLMHGFGTKFWGIAEVEEYTNNKYIGQWKNNKQDGIGKYEWADGSYYEGPWKDGDQHGEGIYVFANGEVFKGKWVEGYCKELAVKLGLE
jgi:hypothetical protein